MTEVDQDKLAVEGGFITVAVAEDGKTYRGARFIGEYTSLITSLQGLDVKPQIFPQSEFDSIKAAMSNHWEDLLVAVENGLPSLTLPETTILHQITNLFEVGSTLPENTRQRFQLGVIEGPTGVGKTTVAESLGYPLISEHVVNNYWLPASTDPQTARAAAFSAQAFFMLGRYSDLANAHAYSVEKLAPFFIADRYFEGDAGYITAHQLAGNISLSEVELLNSTRDLLSPLSPRRINRHTIMLYCEPHALRKRIITRGRAFEQERLDDEVATQANTLASLWLSIDEVEDAMASEAGLVHSFVPQKDGEQMVYVVNTTGLCEKEVVHTVGNLIRNRLG